MESETDSIQIKHDDRGPIRKRLMWGLTLMILGLVLMVVCAIMAANYSHKAAGEWFNSARQAVAKSDSLEDIKSATGRDLSQMSAEERGVLENTANDLAWSAAYDPQSSIRNQGLANALGMVGLLGFFIFAGATITVLLASRSPHISIQGRKGTKKMDSDSR